MSIYVILAILGMLKMQQAIYVWNANLDAWNAVLQELAQNAQTLKY